MAYRLTKIVTRSGDGGETGLGDGSRIAKSAPRIAALGDVDELNAVVGVLLSNELPPLAQRTLIEVQHDLFDLGGELAVPGGAFVDASRPQQLEQVVADYNAELGPLQEFILPGGVAAAALAHHARTVCRRAERSVVALAASEEVSEAMRQYLNRLSDLLFVLARWLNKQAGVADVAWNRNRDA